MCMTKQTEEKSVKRDYKSRMFTMIFRDKKELLQLYNAVGQRNYEDPELLTINTLENAIYMSMQNDLSFVIDSRLSAVSSIISWFNITSYDYSFVRADGFDSTKRYTPRYYFYIDGIDESDDVFDPTYVGDFKISIYAIDDVGNRVENATEVTLKIVDTTKPETGEMHVFNAPVVCNDGDSTKALCKRWLCITRCIRKI